MRKYYGEMLLIALFTALIGQIHIYPFGTDFRITLGVVVFTFLILYFKVPIMATAAISTLFIVVLRSSLDLFGGGYPIDLALTRHLPAVVYYMIYSLIIERIGIRTFIHRPVYFIVIVSVADTLSNFFELLVRNNIYTFPFETVIRTVVLVALIRSVMVLGLFWMIRGYNLIIVKEAHQKRYQELLMLTARLNSEVLFLNKSMQAIEDVMVKSYSIYTHSKSIADGSKEALKRITEDSLTLAIDIHEIKKDYLRIVYSIRKIIPEEALGPSMSLKEIIRTVQDIYSGYCESTGHLMQLKINSHEDLKIVRYYEVISILNNLIHNAMDATIHSKDPEVRIDVQMSQGYIHIKIEDNGKGIELVDRDLIFEPGFTTKVEAETGELPTGLGLTHVKVLTELLGGTIAVSDSLKQGATFHLRLPIAVLTIKED
jgi:two-component system sensor histidine kinase YcbA